MQKFKLAILFCLILYTCATNAQQEDNTIAWTDIILNGSFNQHENWKYFIQPQFRWIDRKNNLEHAVLRLGLGYAQTDYLIWWLGGQWLSYNQVTERPQIGYSWQRVDYRLLNQKWVNFWGRTQIDERKQEGQSTWSIRLRERFTLLLPQAIHCQWTPVIYNEIFFYLNQMHWSKNDETIQNRFFAGVDIPSSRSTYWEIGYFNQSFFRTAGNRINNGIYLSFVINL